MTKFTESRSAVRGRHVAVRRSTGSVVVQVTLYLPHEVLSVTSARVGGYRVIRTGHSSLGSSGAPWSLYMFSQVILQLTPVFFQGTFYLWFSQHLLRHQLYHHPVQAWTTTFATLQVCSMPPMHLQVRNVKMVAEQSPEAPCCKYGGRWCNGFRRLPFDFEKYSADGEIDGTFKTSVTGYSERDCLHTPSERVTLVQVVLKDMEIRGSSQSTVCHNLMCGRALMSIPLPERWLSSLAVSCA